MPIFALTFLPIKKVEKYFLSYSLIDELHYHINYAINFQYALLISVEKTNGVKYNTYI